MKGLAKDGIVGTEYSFLPNSIVLIDYAEETPKSGDDIARRLLIICGS